MTCPIEAITHNDDNVVVDAEKCNFCMDCIPVCPTGSIDEWRVVKTPYSLDQQFDFTELPEQEEFSSEDTQTDSTIEALDDDIAALLADAHSGAGGKARAPVSAAKPSVNLYNRSKPAKAIVQGNFKLTSGESADEKSDNDVRHLILDLKNTPFPVLEGQSIGVVVPGVDANGKPHSPRLYSVSSPRTGERPNYNNLSLTVKREPDGLCSGYLCDLKKGDELDITGPFGSTFLMPNDNAARILMICTGTGSAPFRAFTMQRERAAQGSEMETMMLVFGARTPESLPYFGPLKKVPSELLKQHLVFSRVDGEPKRYVQDELRDASTTVTSFLKSDNGYIYICGLRAMEQGVEEAMSDIASDAGLQWREIRDVMREDGRYHVETY